MTDHAETSPVQPAPPRSLPGARRRSLQVDRVASLVGAGAACALAMVVAGFGLAVVDLAAPSLRRFGIAFLWGHEWAPARGEFGAAPFLWGTLVTSLVALALAVPIGIGVALFLTDLGPRRLRSAVAALVSLLAAIPSVVYGLWAALVLAPFLRTTVEPWLEGALGFLPFFRGPKLGFGILCASLVLTLMVLPTVTSISREVLRAVPSDLREGGLALGATRWDVVRRIVLPHARSGLGGAILLGLARAASETMAVAAVVGSRPDVSASLFAPGYTMSSVIANEFPVATSELHVAALAEIGLVLFVVTLIFNVVARAYVRARSKASTAREVSR